MLSSLDYWILLICVVRLLLCVRVRGRGSFGCYTTWRSNGLSGRLEETMIQMAQWKCGSVLKYLENETVYCRCTQTGYWKSTGLSFYQLELDWICSSLLKNAVYLRELVKWENFKVDRSGPHGNFEAILIFQYNQLDFFIRQAVIIGWHFVLRITD